MLKKNLELEFVFKGDIYTFSSVWFGFDLFFQ